MRPKRPRDPFQLAHQVFQEASGEAPPQVLPENDPATIAKRKGGIKGGAKRGKHPHPRAASRDRQEGSGNAVGKNLSSQAAQEKRSAAS